MSLTNQVVDNLEEKVTTLIRMHQTLKAQQLLLEEKLNQLEAENATLVSQLRRAEEKQMTLKTANALLGSNEFKRETKLKINSLLREIDDCIAGLAE